MNDQFVYTLPDTIDLNTNDNITVTLDNSTWDDSFTTTPTSIYSSTGNVSIEGELKVDGVDVMQSIKDIQRVLGVVSRDLDKEEKYKGLKRAAEVYERELAKIETFEILKESK